MDRPLFVPAPPRLSRDELATFLGSPEDYERAKQLIAQQHPWLKSV